MPKEIQYSRRSVKYLRTLAKNVRTTIKSKIMILADTPEKLANNITKIQGEEDLYRLRVGDYRIIYTDMLEILNIEHIGPRGGVYKK